MRPAAIIVMGVSGSGKSTIGALLAERLGWPFADADGFHPPENVAKMAAGTPLTSAASVDVALGRSASQASPICTRMLSRAQPAASAAHMGPVMRTAAAQRPPTRGVSG
jgi:adenylate kinase family enzyme